MRRWLLLTSLALATALPVRSAVAQCPGTSGSATIGGVAWTADCVIAATAPDCVDSTGSEYECFQIVGSSSTSLYGAVSLFLASTPSQGQTYPLGGGSDNAAMVIGEAGFWLTGEAPYTGSVTITTYDVGNGTISCTFAFTAAPLLFGTPLTVADGVFTGTLLPVEASTWSDLKSLYR